MSTEPTRCRAVFRTLIGDYRCHREQRHRGPHTSTAAEPERGRHVGYSVTWRWPTKRVLSEKTRRAIGEGVRRSRATVIA